MTLGRYLPYDSIMHKMDPRAKIMSLLLVLITIFFDAGFSGYLLIALFSLTTLKLSKISLSYLIKSIKPMLFMMCFLAVVNIFVLRTGEILVTIGSFPIYKKALMQTAYIVIRLVLIVSLTTVVTATTKPLDLTLRIESLLTPFRKIGFPAHEVAMMISIALRFIPTLLEETERIMKAQASRGVDFKEGKLMEKISAIISLIVPLFISSFARAEELANAMEARGYHPDAKRTRYKLLHWQVQDTYLMVISVGLMVSIIAMSVVGTW